MPDAEAPPDSARGWLPPPEGLTLEDAGPPARLVLSFPLPGSQQPPTALTPAEAEVLRDLVRGLSNRDIAAQRGVSVHTVTKQVSSVLRKLGVQSRLDAALRVGRGA
jgi:DNA-binding NarL/FixJ family response regulator